jgi:hypothetical protein
MKTAISLLATAIAGYCLITTAEAAANKPTKRTLSTPVLTPSVESDLDRVVGISGDLAAAWANVDYKVSFSVTWNVANDEATTDVDETATGTLTGVAELGAVVPMVAGAGSATFTDAEILAAVEAAIEELDIRADATVDPAILGCESVSVKTWTTSNSVTDSKPASATVQNCE